MNLKDPHCEFIERKGDMKVNKKTSINIKKSCRPFFDHDRHVQKDCNHRLQPHLAMSQVLT